MRHRKRTTNRGSASQELMERAIKEVLFLQRKCRTVANEYDIPHVTLRRYCIKYKESHPSAHLHDNPVTLETYGYRNNRQVFSKEQEELLAEYCIKASLMYYGICPAELKYLAYNYAIKLNLSVPGSWKENKTAGPDWYTAFMKRNSNISLRSP